jgi:hypothetical protein
VKRMKHRPANPPLILLHPPIAPRRIRLAAGEIVWLSKCGEYRNHSARNRNDAIGARWYAGRRAIEKSRTGARFGVSQWNSGVYPGSNRVIFAFSSKPKYFVTP